MVVKLAETYIPAHTLSTFILFKIQEIVHSSFVVVLSDSVFNILVLPHLKKFLNLLRQRVLRKVLV